MLLDVASETGNFESVKDLKGSPVPNEVVIEQIRASAKIDIPVFKKQYNAKGSFIFVAAGTSIKDFIDEIKERKEKGEFIATSNMTHDYLIENGIIPDLCVVVDPKERVKDYIKNPQKSVHYLIGTVCHPAVAQQLADGGYNVEKLLIGYGMEDESDLNLQRELYPDHLFNYLVGGTMMGLRAMNLALLMGYTQIEYYGMDSCFASNPTLIYEGDEKYEEAKARVNGRYYTDIETKTNYVIDDSDGGFFYAYKKERVPENIQIARTADGKQYITSPCFAHQAKQFIKWYDRMEGKLKIVLHGDNLTSNLLNLHLKDKEHLLNNIGDKRWTDEYSKIQMELHKDPNANYGFWGHEDIEMIGRPILFLYRKLGRNVKVLDYGAGMGKNKKEINKVFNIADVTNYDPFVEEYAKEPEGKFDIVCCMDVMEHIEEECVDNVLKHIASLTNHIAIFSIALVDAKKDLSDGRNAHITQKSAQWWIEKLRKYFLIGENVVTSVSALFMCQSFNSRELMEIEKQGDNGRM